MNERHLFFLIIFGIAILLISITVSLYLIFKKDNIIENYDCYVFSIFWTPTTCTTKYSKNLECFQEVKKLKDDKYFTLHGLWPSLLSGEIPKACNEGKNIIPNFDDDEKFKEKLGKYWPGLYSNNTYLWTNEYNKHGYCYMKRSHYNVIDDYKKYFDKTVKMFESGYRDLMEQILPDSKGVYNVSKEKFENLLKNTNLNITDNTTYSLICDKNTNQLSEIRFVLDLNYKRVAPKKYQNSCPDIFVLNFTDDEKIPVYDKYDVYVFSISYGPTTCRVRGKQCYEILKYKKYNKFILHGLWPTYKSGVIPQMCNIGMDIDVSLTDERNISEYWYSLYNTNKFFWTHEYNKHGMCYNQRIKEDINDYDIYFDKVMEIYHKNNFSRLFDFAYEGFFPRLQKVNKTYLYSKLSQRYLKNSFYLTCKKIDNEFYLDELRFNFDIDFSLTTDAKAEDTCPEEFMLEITDKQRTEEEQDYGIAANYNLYVYSIFFQSTTCKIRGYQCYKAIEYLPKNIWTIHGLWPNYKNGTIPKWCNGKNDIDIEIKNQSLYDYMVHYWPGLMSTNESFWGHEYNRHGYCYNQRNNINVYDYETYFLKAIEIYQKYDLQNIFINIRGDSTKGEKLFKREEVEKYFESKGIEKGTYLLLCEKINVDGKIVSYAYEMRIRFELDFSLYKNETQIDEKDCPEEFMAEFL